VPARRHRHLPRLLACVAVLMGLVGTLGVVLAGAGSGHHAVTASPAPRPPATLRLHHAGPRPARPAFTVRGARARAARIPILMYHVVSAPPAGTANPMLWVDPAAFRAQMLALARRGYVAVTLREAHEAWTRGAPLPQHPVVVSFDDGYLGDYTHARPVLRALGWPGVLNVVLHNVGPGGLTPHEIRGLLADGWELDSHTLTHPDLTTLDATALRRELVDSRSALRRRFGVRADFFCYPSGRYDARVIAAVRAAGYLGATTTDPGLAGAGQGFALRRVRVDGGESTRSLLAAVAAPAT
jgi:peptidoglycan/xylan/chitin deacetylase (PgdA/CDA1 family)